MACTVDFKSFTDRNLVLGYFRLNGDRFPDNLEAMRAEFERRGLKIPDRKACKFADVQDMTLAEMKACAGEAFQTFLNNATGGLWRRFSRSRA